MNSRSTVALGVLALAVLVGLVGWLVVADPAAPSVEERAPAAVEKPRPAPRSVRLSLPPPPGIEPERPDERPEPAVVTPDDRRAMNYAVDDVITAARTDCIEPWLADEADEGPPVSEFVFDAVLHDGRLADVGVRSLHRDMPVDVISCIADRAWYADWPEWDLPGELRLQRAIEVSGSAPNP